MFVKFFVKGHPVCGEADPKPHPIILLTPYSILQTEPQLQETGTGVLPRWQVIGVLGQLAAFQVQTEQWLMIDILEEFVREAQDGGFHSCGVFDQQISRQDTKSVVQPHENLTPMAGHKECSAAAWKSYTYTKISWRWMHDLKKFRISSSVARNGIPVQGETRVSRLQLSLCLVCVKVRKYKSSRRQHPANPRLGNMSLSSRIPSYIIPLMRIMHVIVGRDQAVQLTSTHKCLTAVTGKEHVTSLGQRTKTWF